jgi:hypothetical protein
VEHGNATPEQCITPGCVQPEDQNCPLGLCNGCWWWASDSLAEHRKATPRPQSLGTIYVIQVGDRLKIGFSTRIKQRIKAYPPGSVVLAFHESVYPIDEKELHDRCTQYRIAGREWYRDAPEMREIIAEMVAKHGEPPAWIQPKWGSGQNRPVQSRGRGRRAQVVHSKPWLT